MSATKTEAPAASTKVPTANVKVPTAKATKPRPDKKKVIDEVWDDDHVKSFLHKSVPRQSGQDFPGDADFHVLRHAYHNMRPNDFRRFLAFFVAEGRDVRARSASGETLAEAIATHAHAGPFIDALNHY